MLDYDRSNFITFLNNFSGQIDVSKKIIENVSLELDTSKFQNIVIAGMGGSAMAGELFSGYAQEELKIPTQVIRDYSIPGYISDRTLFINISYSGNTEETLTALKAAIDRSATVVGISSGGEVENICVKNRYRFIKIPGGYPPRQALGYLFFPLLFMFTKLGFISQKEKEISETKYLLQEYVDRYNPKTSLGNNLANHIAQSIYHAIPVIYTGAPYLGPVSVRWRNQFNENSKALAFSNIFPEMNHNEIMGWEGLQEVNKHFRVIFLRDAQENPRIKQRIKITKGILKGQNILFGEVFTEGQSRLARLFSLISTGDWASYYWALLNEKDPIKIDSIDLLKQKLSEVVV